MTATFKPGDLITCKTYEGCIFECIKRGNRNTVVQQLFVSWVWKTQQRTRFFRKATPEQIAKAVANRIKGS